MVKAETFNPDATDLVVPGDDVIAPLVARLPAERMNMRDAAKWLKSNKLRDSQKELIEKLQPLAEIVALQVGVGRYRLHIDEAKSTATKYLIQAVVAGPVGDTAEFVESRIKNGLHNLSKLLKRHSTVVEQSNRTVNNMNDEGDVVEPERCGDRMNDLIEGIPSRRVESIGHSVPVDPADSAAMEAYRQKQDDDWRRIQNKLRIRDDKHIDVWDLGRQQYESISSDLETPQQRTIWRLVLADETLDDAATALRMARHEVLEIARTLPA